MGVPGGCRVRVAGEASGKRSIIAHLMELTNAMAQTPTTEATTPITARRAGS